MDTVSAKGKERATDDALFLERLDMLYEQSLSDLRAFADRENRPFDEVRRRIAELHSKYLFESASDGIPTTNKKELTRRILLNVSQHLESLETLAGLQSFFLVVDPNDPVDEGFLGGTVLGREFWRGHRGCGSAGAQMFKAQCARSAHARQRSHAPPTAIDPALLPAPASPAPAGTKGPARELKTELYAAMRSALRAASGIRTAEMKWTNHSKLDVYGVRVVGWPASIPLQNPSTLSVAQNKLLLDMLGTGQITFRRLDGAGLQDSSQGRDGQSPDEEAMFEDSIYYSWVSEGEPHGVPPHLRSSTPPLSPPHAIQGARVLDSRQSAASHPGPVTPKKRRIEDR
ncbi:hypothetical protein C8Q77DRAFT_1270176 [Trametes polyzona]|nr:hypothetical protein C8Q77DRAFT_1270176 [Trametes polyzona]